MTVVLKGWEADPEADREAEVLTEVEIPGGIIPAAEKLTEEIRLNQIQTEPIRTKPIQT